MYTGAMRWGLLVACVVMVLVGVLAIDGGEVDIPVLGCTGLLAAACALPLVMSLQGWRLRLDHPTTIMAAVLACYWLMGGLYARYAHSFMCIGSKDYTWASALAGAVAAAGFYLGAGLPKQEDSQSARLSRGGMWAWFALTAALFAIRAWQMRRGVYFTHKAIADVDTSPAEALLDHATYALRVAPCVLAVGLFCNGRIWLGAAAIAAEVAYTLFSGSRLFLLHVGLFVAVALAMSGKRLHLMAIAGAMAVFVLAVNPFVMTMRRAMVSDATEAPTTFDVASATMGYEGQSGGDRDVAELMARGSAASYLANVMCFSELTGLGDSPLNGSTYVDSVLLLVPRIVWEGKPPLPGADVVGVMSARLGLRPSDAVASPIAEAYLNFGHLGVFVAYVLMGLLARALWAFRVNRADSLSAGGLYLMSMAVFALFETHSTIGMLTGLRLPAALMVALMALEFTSGARQAAIIPETG